jgi:hypothetical protein
MKNAIKNIKQLAKLWSSLILKKCISKEKENSKCGILVQNLFFSQSRNQIVDDF